MTVWTIIHFKRKHFILLIFIVFISIWLFSYSFHFQMKPFHLKIKFKLNILILKWNSLTWKRNGIICKWSFYSNNDCVAHHFHYKIKDFHSRIKDFHSRMKRFHSRMKTFNPRMILSALRINLKYCSFILTCILI